MTSAEQLQAEIAERRASILALMQLWELSVSAASCPDQAQFLTWLDLHAFERVAFAIREAGRKQIKRGSKMDDDHAVRFVSSVANRLTREAKVAA